MDQQPATVAERIESLANDIAARESAPEFRDEWMCSLVSLAEFSRSCGQHDVASVADSLISALGNPSLADGELGRVLSTGIDLMQDSLRSEVNAPAPVPTDLGQDPELIADFVLESREHLDSIESQLLAIDGGTKAPEAVHAIFRSFHTIKGLAGFLGLSVIQELAHEVETVLDRARQGELRITETAVDVILASRDYIGRWLTALETGAADSNDPQLARPAALLRRVQSLGESTGLEPLPAPEPEPRLTAKTEPQRNVRTGRSVKVDTEKLDYLVDMVGEMVIAQSLVRHDPELSGLQNPRLHRNLAQLARITDEVQRTAMAMRMVPIGPLFQKMNRLVRDLSRKSGKPIELDLEGENVELDRNIVEELADPLMHMVRNSVDHGIEPAAARAQRGKPPLARLGLRAFHRSGQIVIEVSDDGGGISRERVLSKARERGLVAPNAALSDSDILNLIFQPGFSTAEKVSDISGRGVGMDVVRKQIQRLRGSIDISSVEGTGTTFSLRVPLTLAIIDGLVVKTGEERYIIPLASVTEMLRPAPGAVSRVENRAEVVSVRDRLLPVVRLHEKFAIQPRATDPAEGVLIVTEADGAPFCLMVDELVGKQEVVIKSLGPVFRHVAGVAGGAILGDGQIGLILDLKGIFSGRRDL